MADTKNNVREKLAAVQAEVNAPKNRINTYGGFNYRSQEDILEAVKPILKKYKAAIRLSDKIVQIGDRYYVNAEAYFIDCESDGTILVEAFAREPEDKKGMDAAQITGTASSYARKYALNGLLLLDDAKDPDTDEYKAETEAKAAKAAKPKPTKQAPKEADASDLDKFVNDAQLKTLEMLLARAEVTAEKFNKIYGLTILSELPADKYDDAVKKLETAIKVKEKGE